MGSAPCAAGGCGGGVEVDGVVNGGMWVMGVGGGGLRWVLSFRAEVGMLSLGRGSGEHDLRHRFDADARRWLGHVNTLPQNGGFFIFFGGGSFILASAAWRWALNIYIYNNGSAIIVPSLASRVKPPLEAFGRIPQTGGGEGYVRCVIISLGLTRIRDIVTALYSAPGSVCTS